MGAWYWSQASPVIYKTGVKIYNRNNGNDIIRRINYIFDKFTDVFKDKGFADLPEDE